MVHEAGINTYENSIDCIIRENREEGTRNPSRPLKDSPAKRVKYQRREKDSKCDLTPVEEGMQCTDFSP